MQARGETLQLSLWLPHGAEMLVHIRLCGFNLYGNHSTDNEAAVLILYQEYFTFTKGLKRSCSNWANEAAPLLPAFTVALLTPSSPTHLKE